MCSLFVFRNKRKQEQGHDFGTSNKDETTIINNGKIAAFVIAAYLLKATTVEAEKQPLLRNARTQQQRNCHVTRCDACSRSYGTIE
jgi:hypothetical protein